MGSPLRDAVRRNDVYALINTKATVKAFVEIARDDLTAAERTLDEVAKTLRGYTFQMQHVYCMNAACTLDFYRGEPEKVLARLEAHKKPLRKSLFERVQSVRVMWIYLT